MSSANRLDKAGMKVVTHTIAVLGYEKEQVFEFFHNLTKAQMYKNFRDADTFFTNLCVYYTSDMRFMQKLLDDLTDEEMEDFCAKEWVEEAEDYNQKAWETI